MERDSKHKWGLVWGFVGALVGAGASLLASFNTNQVTIGLENDKSRIAEAKESEERALGEKKSVESRLHACEAKLRASEESLEVVRQQLLEARSHNSEQEAAHSETARSERTAVEERNSLESSLEEANRVISTLKDDLGQASSRIALLEGRPTTIEPARANQAEQESESPSRKTPDNKTPDKRTTVSEALIKYKSWIGTGTVQGEETSIVVEIKDLGRSKIQSGSIRLPGVSSVSFKLNGAFETSTTSWTVSSQDRKEVEEVFGANNVTAPGTLVEDAAGLRFEGRFRAQGSEVGTWVLKPSS